MLFRSKVLMSNSRKEALQNLFPSYTIEKKVNTYNFFSSHYVCSTLKIYSIPSTKLIEVLNSVYPIKNIYKISNNTNEIAKNILLQYMQSKIFRYKRNKKFKPFYLNFITTHSTDVGTLDNISANGFAFLTKDPYFVEDRKSVV